MAGNVGDLEIDRTRKTVQRDGDTERSRVHCDTCASDEWHVLMYAFAPPSEIEGWRCESCGTRVKTDDEHTRFAIDRTRKTVQRDGDTERSRVHCDTCASDEWHVLMYAFAPPSEIEGWRCESCGTRVKTDDEHTRFAIDRTRKTVQRDGDTERSRVHCDTCASDEWHVLMYAFAPPSDFERWRCSSCKTVATVRGGPA
jgi:ferredoxin